jgi:hypothetical protein
MFPRSQARSPVCFSEIGRKLFERRLPWGPSPAQKILRLRKPTRDVVQLHLQSNSFGVSKCSRLGRDC